MMRIVSFAALLFLIAVPLARASADPKGADFVAWALERSAECDERWDRMLERADVAPPVKAVAETGPATRSSPGQPVPAAKLSVDFCSASGLMHAVAGDSERFARSSRERGDPVRGTAVFDLPVSARLSTAFDRLGSVRGSLERRISVTTNGSVTRPRLNSFGRFSQTSTRSAAARPGSRPARPRAFR